MTYEELSQHRLGPKVYVALKGKVFDVSSNDVYKEGGGYHAFAGRDASVALAKMNFGEELMDPAKTHFIYYVCLFTHWSKKGELNGDQMKILDDWVVFYEKRYKIIA
jgi:predicted heme/steroid binding protein